eukprot:CAMPEP_0185822060 /NCGR_PEP_ID=MMETSP1322-20130828/26139_1 /TAXON_ID=265543 /ORGANISM="Minutocellus polymorphus, Strain RCC2270" /LENGTH=32 /DNA_ID= /DNA_START= /DNA_END= /DNA_ORIENTATION=
MRSAAAGSSAAGAEQRRFKPTGSCRVGRSSML